METNFSITELDKTIQLDMLSNLFTGSFKFLYDKMAGELGAWPKNEMTRQGYKM